MPRRSTTSTPSETWPPQRSLLLWAGACWPSPIPNSTLLPPRVSPCPTEAGRSCAGRCAVAWPGVRGIGRLGAQSASRATDSGLPKGSEAGSLLLSGLALAGANRRQEAALDQEDGILTAEEIAALDLRGVEWAVVS